MELLTDELESASLSPYLEHHGTKGMKWGVWNAETRKRYLGRASAIFKKAGAGVSDSLNASIKKRKDAQEAKKAQKLEIKNQRKELGMSKAKYDKLRAETLKSHDPRVVERGMHTLTDDELNIKIARLQKEELISKMASSRETRMHNEHKARSEAISANPLFKVAKGVADKKIDEFIKGTTNKAVEDALKKAAKEAGKESGESKESKESNESAQQSKTMNSKLADDVKNWNTPVVQLNSQSLSDNKNRQTTNERKPPSEASPDSANTNQNSKVADNSAGAVSKVQDAKIGASSVESAAKRGEAWAESSGIIDANVVASSIDSDEKRKG